PTYLSHLSLHDALPILQGITYDIPVKSAQVKSAILLAGLFAEGETRIRELAKTRDHTENILAAFGVDIMVDGNEVTVSNKGGLRDRKSTRLNSSHVSIS